MSTSGKISSKVVESFARIGISAKGVVYVLTGVLAFMAAFEIGNKDDASQGGVFDAIMHQVFGKILLGILAAGLICYCAWRFLATFKDTENKGSDKKGYLARARYFISGLAYAGLAFSAIRFIFTPVKKGSGNSQKKVAAEILSEPTGQWLLGIAGIVIIIIGLYQIYLSVSGKFKKHVEEGKSSPDGKTMIYRAGWIGYVSRGLVWMIIGWLFIKAAWMSDSNQAGGTNEAFKWIETSSYGSYLLGAIALGLICYGFYMFVRAKYQPISG